MKTLDKFDLNEIISNLKNDGVVRINHFIDIPKTGILEEYRKLFWQEKSDWLEPREYSLGEAVLMTTTKIPSAFQATRSFFSDSRMQQVVDAYLPGQQLTANHKVWAVKDIVGSTHHANDLHFDVQQTLKFFLYLSDTTAQNGAFRCVPGSHKITADIRKKTPHLITYENREFSRQLPFGPADAVSVDGEAGTLIIFDTDVFHQAGKVSVGERWVMRGQTESAGKAPQAEKGFLQKLIRKIKK